MRKLNRQHRGINKATDVLSFPSSPEKGEFNHVGDIVICLQTAEKKAKRLGVSRRRQVETLVIHGFLHLCGHDHEKDSGEMMALQTSLEKELLQDEPLPMGKKRGRKPGSRLKTLKNGTRVVVTGRAAQAIARREHLQKEKAARKAAAKPGAKAAGKAPKAVKAKDKKRARTKAQGPAQAHRAAAKGAKAPGRLPGRPRKNAERAAAVPAPKRQAGKRRQARPRSGIIS